ncbi:MAG TPA: hypothetical protein VJ783_11390 [Pirellulales bacterium]|nr:hypothetical protein [Pirellulales bacterium]
MSTQFPSSPPRPRIRIGLMLLMVGGGLLGLLLLLLAGAWIGSRRDLNAELDRIRAAGEPASAAEIEAFYQVPPGARDTTQLWLAALAPLDTRSYADEAKELPLVGDNANDLPLPGEPWPQLDAAEQLLARYRGSLEEMHQAAREGGQARFPTRFADGIQMLLPHAQQLRIGARLLALESVVAAHRGQPDAAVDSIVAMFAVARSLEQEPVLISQLVRMALGGMARQRIQWLLSAATLDDGQLARLDAELAASDYQKPLRQGLLGERVIGIVGFENPETLGGEAVIGRLTGSSDQAMYLERMNEMIAAADKSGPERKAAIELAEMRLRQLAGTTSARLKYPLTLLLLPALSAAADAATRNEAERDATRVAVAFERFRLREGRLPEKLDELVPDFLGSVPSDPYGGGPLHYRADETEYLVYSVGPNGIDDGGQSDPSSSQPVDLVVRVRRKNRP